MAMTEDVRSPKRRILANEMKRQYGISTSIARSSFEMGRSFGLMREAPPET